MEPVALDLCPPKMFQVPNTVPAIVLDAGSHTIKAGSAGEDLPHALLSSHLSSHGYIDHATTVAPDPSAEVTTPFGADGLIDSWDVFEGVLSATLGRLASDPREHALLYAEPNHNGKAARERLVETLFETFDVPASYLARSAVLAAYASGRTTGIVLDVGHAGVSAVPVVEGAVVEGGFLRSDVGGAAVSGVLKGLLGEKGCDLRPAWMRAPGASASESYRRYAGLRVLDEAKAALCRVQDVSGGCAGGDVEWALPDGEVVRMGKESGAAAEEVLFGTLGHHKGVRDEGLSYVQMVARRERGAGATGGASSQGVHGLVLDAVNRCDASTHRDMYAGVCLTGGTSDMTGFYERISGGLAETYHKVRVLAATGSMERKYCTWTGGSILGTFSEFQKLWIAKSEFEEVGPSIVHKRCV